MGESLWDVFAIDVMTAAEFRIGFLCDLVRKKYIEFSHLSIGTYKVQTRSLQISDGYPCLVTNQRGAAMKASEVRSDTNSR